MRERTFDEFDEYASDYRSVHTQNIKLSGADSFYFAKMKVKLLRSTEKNVPLKILDLGCGDGATELFMQEFFPDWKVTGIDVSRQSIDVAMARKLSNAEFLIYDGSKTNYPNGSFDIIFVAGVLHHVNFDLHPDIIKEIWRLLKKGGRLYLFEHNPLNPVTRHLVNTCVFDKHARLLDCNYSVNLLRKNQLTIVKRDFIIFFPRKGLLSKLIFLEPYLRSIPFGGQYFIQAIKP
ncbi:MAG: class I SAM-dependent methyltransferase [Ferruginibacter sp.]